MLIRIARGSWQKVMPEALIRVVARGETGVDHQVDHYEKQEAMLIRIARGSWQKVMPEALIRVVARGETGVDHQVDHYEKQEAQTELE